LGLWVEFFGLSGGLKEYDETIEQKLVLIKKYKLQFMALYPKDLFPANNLGKIFS
jgi:hypothetical protein